MTIRHPKISLRSSLGSLLLGSSLVGGLVGCSFSETPSVTQVLPTLSVQAPESPEPQLKSISFYYYDGVKTSITIIDAAILFAASTLNTDDPVQIANFVNSTLKLTPPITASDVTALGNPLQPAISDFTGDGVVNINDAAVLFAAVSTGGQLTASKINTFLATTLKLSDVRVTQAQLDSFFSSATPTPTPTLTPTPTPTLTLSDRFYIHPKLGNDTYPGTSPLQPFRTLKQALTSAAVQSSASLGGGTNVTVTILDKGGESLEANVATPALTQGSVTVVLDSGVDYFLLVLLGKTLTLNKGYKLQGLSIIAGDPAGATTAAAAITLNAAGTPLKDITINCMDISTGPASAVGEGDKCLHVPNTVGGTVILDKVAIVIPSNQNFVTGILHEGTGTLKVINASSVSASESGNAKGVVGIYGKTTSGSVEVMGTVVTFQRITATGGNVFPILLSGPISSGKVEGSGIVVQPSGAIGVCVKTSNSVTVQGNTLATDSSSIGNSIAICNELGTVLPTPMPTGNYFNYFVGFPLQNQYVTSGCSCP